MILKFTITGEESQVINFEKDLLEILNRFMADQATVSHEILFCVHEAILNIIQHTYHWDLTQPIIIQITLTDSDKLNRVFEISLKDTGKPVDKELTPPVQINPFQLRQRGLYMISKIMDEFSLSPQKEKGNITYMKKVMPVINPTDGIFKSGTREQKIG